jgi:hypothetical protein
MSAIFFVATIVKRITPKMKFLRAPPGVVKHLNSLMVCRFDGAGGCGRLSPARCGCQAPGIVSMIDDSLISSRL